MGVISIQGQRVQVDDAFFQLSLEEQNAQVDQIAQSMGIGQARQERTPYEAPPPPPGFFEGLRRQFTGEDRITQRAQETPELSWSDLLAGESVGATANIAALSLITPDPREMAQILQSNFPHIEIDQDQQGNLYAINQRTGAEAILNRPGFSYSDFISLIGTGLAFTPAGRGLGAGTRLGRVGQVAGRSGLTATAIEEAQQMAGGEFNPEDIALETVLGAGGQAAGEAIGAAARARANRLAGQAGEARQAAELAEAQRLQQPLSPELQQAQQTQLLSQIAQATEETGGRTIQAELPKLRELAQEADIDPEALAAAQRLGVAEELLPSQLARNPEYIEIEQGLASIIGSQLNAQQKLGYQAVAQKADDLITEFGGSLDKAALSDQLRDTILTNINRLEDSANKIFAQVNEIIPGRTKVDMPKSLLALQKEAVDQGGVNKLEPIEQHILRMSRETPTYANLDKERQKLGAAIQRREGPYKDAETGMLKNLYSMVLADQQAAADRLGAGNLFKMGRDYVKMRKKLENSSLVVLGRDKTSKIMPVVGQAVKKLSKGDVRDFDRAMEAIPSDQRQVAVLSALNDAFTGPGREQKQLAVPYFVDWYNGLQRNQAAKKRIMQYVPKNAQARLDDLFKVAEGMRRAGKERVTTGRIRSLLDDFNAPGGFVDKVFATTKEVGPTALTAEVAGQIATGVPGAGGTIAGVVKAMSQPAKEPLSAAAGKLLADPEFQKLTRELARSTVQTEAALQRAADAVTRSKVYQDWLDALPSDHYKQALRLGIVGYFTSPPPDPTPYESHEGGPGQVLELTITPEDIPTPTNQPPQQIPQLRGTQ